MPDMNMAEAVNRALADAIAANPEVVLLYDDIGINGGVFRSTVGLQAHFGAQQGIDTPLAESAIVGPAVGMTAIRSKPVAEIQFTGFIYPAIDQIVNHASRLRHRTRGRLSRPLVVRSPCGGIHAHPHHSESLEAMFAHLPGLRVLISSSPGRGYSLLLAAIRGPDPSFSWSLPASTAWPAKRLKTLSTTLKGTLLPSNTDRFY